MIGRPPDPISTRGALWQRQRREARRAALQAVTVTEPFIALYRDNWPSPIFKLNWPAPRLV